ncbi:MAG TPA: DUF4247 domain-containing protein [Candidatus Stackebrandtia faecavium]|nr:DUF4247 domain-containing protein [Candidatus Stackebrandtia faecavium]
MSKSAGWAVFGIVAAIGLLIAIVAVSNTSASPREFIAKKYDCNVNPTKSEEATCTSRSTVLSTANAISRDTRPIDRGEHDGMRFLQYDKEIVAISDRGGKTEVEIDDYDDAYRRHSSHIAFFGWSSTGPRSSHGGGYGGGGFGGGK